MYSQLESMIRKEVALPADFWNELYECGEVICLKKGDFLLRQGEVCRHGYFLNRGSLIQLFQNENGKEIVLGFYIDHVYSFLSSPNSYFYHTGAIFEIRALEECELLAFSRECLEKLANRFAPFSLFYHKITANALHNMYLYSAMRLSMSAEEFLNYLISRQPEIMRRIPDKYIARFIGVSDEWLCKVKKKAFFPKKDIDLPNLN